MSSPTQTIVAAPLTDPGLRDIQLLSAGHMPQKASRIDHTFGMWAVGLVVSGRGTYRMEGGCERAIEPGSLFTVFPGPSFHYGPEPGTTWDEYCFCATGPGIERWIEAGWFFDDGSVRPIASPADFVQQWRELIRTIRRAKPGDADRASLIAERLVLELYHASGESAPDRADPSIQAVLAHCRTHLDEPIDFHALARDHAMSYSLLRQDLRKATGLPPARYLASVRCDAARELLLDTDLPIKAIAARVGIADPLSLIHI